MIHLYQSQLVTIFFCNFFLKPITLINYKIEIAKNGKLPAGRTEMAFELPLIPKGNRPLYETYHGVFIAIQV